MPTYEKDASRAANAARLNLLEEKVRNLDPNNPPDLAELTDLVEKIKDAVNRLMRYTVGQGVDPGYGAPTVDTPPTAFWYDPENTQGQDTGSYKSLAEAVFGEVSVSTFGKSGSDLCRSLFGWHGYEWPFNDYSGANWEDTHVSMAERIFGSWSRLNSFVADGNSSMLETLTQLQATVASLQSRVSALESAP